MSDSRLLCLTLVVGNKAGELHSSNDTRDPNDTIWQFCDQISLQSDAVWKLWLLFWIGLDGGTFHFIVDVFLFIVVLSYFRLSWGPSPLTPSPACSHSNGENIEKYSEHKILLLASAVQRSWKDEWSCMHCSH